MKRFFLSGLLAMLLAGAVLAGPPDPHSELVDTGQPIALQTASQTPEPWVWRGRDGEPLPFSDEDHLVEFLREAKVVSRTATEHGINRPVRVVLERDGVTARAVFRTVDRTWRNERGPDGVRRRLYRDSYIYECAAYQLSRLLGLDRVPPAVERSYRGQYGSIQAWVENARMEADLRREDVVVPDIRHWVSRMMQRRLFDTLINNLDRNLGNTLVDEEWEVWLIDHGRSFQIDPDPKRIAEIRQSDRRLWEAMRSSDRAEVERRLRPYLSKIELRALFQRWDDILSHFERIVDELGEESVFFEG